MKRFGSIILVLLVAILLVATFFGCEEESTVVGIEVVSMPTKASYAIGETVVFDGLVVKLKYEDGSYSEEISISALALSSPDTSAAGTKEVIVRYSLEGVDYETSFTITVTAPQHVHSYAEGWSTDDANHWHAATCAHTEEKSGLAAHSYDNACDTACNVCSATRTTTHVYNNACDTACNVCGATRSITHDYAETWSKDGEYHWHVCTVCGAVEGEKEAHTFDNTCDIDCNVCGATRTIAHTYDNDCDTDCNVCGATRITAHVYGTPTVIDPTCTSEGKTLHQCDNCSYYYYSDYVAALSHDYDDAYHCTECGEATYSEDLTFEFHLSDGCNEGGYYVTGYRGKDVTVTIPAYYKGQPVIGIDDYAFYKTDITRVCLPSTLITIEDNAFSQCTYLAYVEIPEENSLEAVSPTSFTYTTWLVENADYLSCILGNVMFGLYEEPTLYEEQTLFELTSSCYSEDTLTVPEGIKYLCGFYVGGIKTLNLPSTLIGIDSNSFAEDVTTINIPEENCLEKIGYDVFQNAPFKSSFDKGEMIYVGNVALGFNSTTWAEFEGDTLTIPDGTVGIAAGAFTDIPLSKVVLPSSLRYIGYDAFAIYSPGTIEGLTEVTINSNSQLHTISSCAFLNNLLTSFVLPKSVTKFSYSAVYTDDLIIERGNPRFAIENGMLIDMANSTLLDNRRNYDIPDGVRIIGSIYNDFSNRDNEDFVLTVPESVTRVETNGIIGFPNVVIGGSLDYVGRYGFHDCGNVSFAANEKASLSWDAEWNLNPMADTIIKFSFARGFGYDELKHGTLDEDGKVVDGVLHDLEHGVCTVCGYCDVNYDDTNIFNYRPDAYGGISLLGYYGNDTEIVIPDYYKGYPVTSISSDFGAYVQIEELYIGANVVSIGEGAFAGDTFNNLHTVDIPDHNSLLYVGEDAFKDTEWLVGSYYNSSVAIIGNVLVGFWPNDSEKYTVIPEGIISICNNAYPMNNAFNTGLALPSTLVYLDPTIAESVKVRSYTWSGVPAEGFAIVDGSLYKKTHCGWFLVSCSYMSTRNGSGIIELVIPNKIDGEPVVGMLRGSMPEFSFNLDITMVLGDEHFVFCDFGNLSRAGRTEFITFMASSDDIYVMDIYPDFGGMNLSINHEHNIEHKPAVEASCAWGHKEYWHCTDCGVCFLDENGEQYLSNEELDNLDIEPVKEHTASDEWKSNASSHWHACTICHYGIDYEGHIYDDGCDSDCNVCGAIRTAPHYISLKFDETHHWRACALCGEILNEKTAHSGGTATCTMKAVCSVCGNYYGETLPHTLTAVAYDEPTCTENGTLAHDHCSVCNQDFIDGVVKSASDLVIAALGHTGGTATCEHRKICEVCEQEYGELGEHTGGEATCEHGKICEVCGREYGELGEHTWEDDECTVCHEQRHTEGVRFMLNDDGNSYRVQSYIDNATKVRIVYTYEGKPVTAIGASAFSGKTSVTDIILPSTVTLICDRAFNNCDSLININLSAVTSIGKEAFSGCDRLKTITLPVGIDVIRENTFYYCTALESITIPSNVLTIEASAFSTCVYLNTVVIESGLKTIGADAFYICQSLTGITIPSSVTAIGKGAFQGCSKLQSAILNEGLESIGEEAFKSTALTTINIPLSVTTVGENVFVGSSVWRVHCYASEKPAGWHENWAGTTATVTWGHTYNYVSNGDGTHTCTCTVTGCGHTETENCSGGTATCTEKAECEKCGGAYGELGDHTWVDDECTVCHEQRHTEGVNFLLNDDSNSYRVKNYDGNATKVRILDTYEGKPVTAIGEGAFYDRPITDVILPHTIKTIEKNGFFGCGALVNIDLPSALETIGMDAFAYCSLLESITLPSTVITIGGGAFTSCSALKQINVPSTVTSIGDNAFSGCSGLKTITLPVGIDVIRENTFYNCSALKNLTIPSNVKTIGANAFDGCTGIETLTIQSGVEIIDSFAFSGCSSLINVTLPSSVTTLGEGAFMSCDKLQSIILNEGLTTIGNFAFGSTGSLESINIPLSVTTVGENVFVGSGVNSIHCYASEKPAGWQENWIGTIATVIWGHTYNYVSNGNGTHTCTCNVTGCSHTETENCSGGTATCEHGKICEVCGKEYGDKAAHTWVNDECTECYEQRNTEGLAFGLINNDTEYEVTGYTGTATKVRILTTYNGKPVTAIANNAFRDCTIIQKVIIPSSVLTIGYYAFRNCGYLETLEIQHGLTTIGVEAFFYCIALKEVILPDSVTTIGDSAFFGCDALEVVIIPSSVITVGSLAFTGSYDTIFHVNWLTNILPDGWDSTWCTDYAQITLGHEFSYTNNGDGTHTITCRVPGCTYSEAPEEHSASGYSWFVNDTHHWQKCSACGAEQGDKTAHTFETEWTTSGTHHWHECSICGGKGDNVPHIYDNTCDTTCNACGIQRLITHNYETEWTTDGTHHWHVCSVCGAIEGVKASHTYDNACDTTCNVCGAEREITHAYETEWTTDGTYHWHKCSVCGAVEGDKVAHTYDNTCDTTCNVCEAIRTITHTPEAEPATCEHSQLCSVCGEVAVAAHTAHDEYGICNICDPDATRGMKYTPNQDNPSYYILYGVGTATNATSIVVPKYYNNLPVIEIYKNAFSGNTVITSVIISDKVTSIGQSAFSSCSSLLTVDMGDGVTTIKGGAFYNCTSLHTIDLSDSLTTIETQAFQNCALTSITIGANVTSIVDTAFAGCMSLTTVIIDSEYVAAQLTNSQSCGYLVNKATAVYVKSSIKQIGSLLTNVNLYTATTSDRTGYVKYVKK